MDYWAGELGNNYIEGIKHGNVMDSVYNFLKSDEPKIKYPYKKLFLDNGAFSIFGHIPIDVVFTMIFEDSNAWLKYFLSQSLTKIDGNPVVVFITSVSLVALSLVLFNIIMLLIPFLIRPYRTALAAPPAPKIKPDRFFIWIFSRM